MEMAHLKVKECTASLLVRM